MKPKTVKDLAYWKANAEEDYMQVPISVLKYISQLEKELEKSYNEKDLRLAYFSAIESTGEGWNGEYAEGNHPNIENKFSEGFEEFFESVKKK